MKGKMRLVRLMLAMAFRYERRRSAISLAMVVLLAGADAATGLAQRWIVDSADTGTVVGVFAAAALGAIAFGMTTTLFRLQANLRGDISHHIAVRLSRETTFNSMAIPTVTHLEHPPFLDRIVMVRQGAYAMAGAGWAMIETISQLVSLGLSIWLLAAVHPVLAFAALFAAAPLYSAHRSRRIVQRAADAAAEAERVENELHSICIGPEAAKEVRTSGSGTAISDRADQIWSKALHLHLIAQLRSSAMQLAGWTAYVTGFIAAVALTVTLVMDGRATYGDVVLVVFLTGILRAQLSGLVGGIVRIGEGGRAMSHYQWFEDYTARALSAAENPAPDRVRRGITFDGVSFSYPGADRNALNNVTLHMAAGSTVALVGINGAGKTTLVKLLTGMYQPTEGTISVDGTDLSDIAPDHWRRRATGTFQDHVKFKFKAHETIGLGNVELIGDRAAVEAVVDEAGARPVVDTLPAGLDTQLGQEFDGVDLSHGQWQRLALARGRMRREPLLVVLDEPTAALDPQAEHDIYERYAAQAEATAASLGTITVMVSHRFSTVTMADQIVVVDQGRVIEHGTHTELLAADGSYARHFRIQWQGYQT